MIDLKDKISQQTRKWICQGIYALAIIYFIGTFLSFYHADFGYSKLTRFGGAYHQQKTEALANSSHYVAPGLGNDGQFYAQQAIHPTLREAQLHSAQDDFSARGRRILFSWTAWLLGGGDSSRIVQAYSVQGAVFWLGLAILLIKWLPPTGFNNAFRYLATLFSAGMIYSVTNALIDGPSLFLIALAVFFAERNKSWVSAGILALAGLGKESNVLAAAALLDQNSKNKESQIDMASKVGLAILPLLIWIGYVYSISGTFSDSLTGKSKIDFPLVGWTSELLWLIKEGGEVGFTQSHVITKAILILCLSVQAGYFIFKPQPKSVWWRVGIAYSIMLLFMGHSVWQGYPGTIVLAALPMTLAFNIHFSKKAWALPLLIACNFPFIIGVQHISNSARHTIQPVINPVETELHPALIDLGEVETVRQQDRHLAEGPAKLLFDPETFETINLEFRSGWYNLESLGSDYWRWSQANSIVTIENPHDFPVEVVIKFNLKTIKARTISLEILDLGTWEHDAKTGNAGNISFKIPVMPGMNIARISSSREGDVIPNDSRSLAFAIYNYEVILLESKDPIPTSGDDIAY